MRYQLRLIDSEICAMQELFKKHFSAGDRLWVFGSRTDIARKGGDIDLYIESNTQDAHHSVNSKINFICDLQQRIGEQKIDCVLNVKELEDELPIYKIARLEGVRII